MTESDRGEDVMQHTGVKNYQHIYYREAVDCEGIGVKH